MRDGFVLFGYPAFPVQPPVDWKANPFHDESWRYQLNTLVFLDPVLAACEKTPDTRLLGFAVSVMRDWLRQNWSVPRKTNPFAWYDMAVGVRAARLAWLVDAAARSAEIADDALSELLQGALRHGQELRDPRNLAQDYNHGIYQMMGLLALTKTLPEMRGFGEYEQYASTAVERMFISHYCEAEGVHLEHSPAYHLYISHLLSTALSTGLLTGRRLETLRDKAFNALAWMIKPDGSITRFGDGENQRRPVSRGVLPAALRSRYPAYWYALSGGAEGAPPQQGELILPQSGYAFIRGAWPAGTNEWAKASYLSFSAGFHSRAHKHADDGTLEWSELGHSLLIDAGTYAYAYEAPERQYCESTRAHNTLEIDGNDTSRDPSKAFGSALKRWAKADGVYALEAEFVREGDVRHRRTLVYAPAEWLIVMDAITARESHLYTQWFHFDPALDVSVEAKRLVVPIPEAKRRLVIQPLGDEPGLTLRTVRGQKEPRLEGWTSLAYKQLVPNWAAAYSTSGRSAILATLFALAPETVTLSDLHIQPSSDHMVLGWAQGSRRIAFVLRRQDGSLVLQRLARP